MNPISACPKCGSQEYRKNGKVRGRQRYLCQKCGYNFSVPKLGKAKPPEVQRQALHLYVEGMSFRGIQRWLGISHVTEVGSSMGEGHPGTQEEAKACESGRSGDRRALYVCGSKKTWVWVGVDRRGRKVLDFVVGGRGESMGRRLYERLRRYRPSIYYTDPWRAYPAVLPASRHRASKGETYTVESVNSLIRHYLARFHRRTRCFSRSVEMMVYSLELLFFLKVNGGWLDQLSILS